MLAKNRKTATRMHAEQSHLRAVGRMIDEGLLIALAATRMALKNQIIIAAIRDHRDYRAEEHVPLARKQIELLIRENEDQATRLRGESVAPTSGTLAIVLPDSDEDTARLERARLQLLVQVYEGLAVALRAEAINDDTVLDLVDAARRDAWQEVGDEIRRKVAAPPDAREDADYERQRDGRLQEFVYIDLAGLVVDT